MDTARALLGYDAAVHIGHAAYADGSVPKAWRERRQLRA